MKGKWEKNAIVIFTIYIIRIPAAVGLNCKYCSHYFLYVQEFQTTHLTCRGVEHLFMVYNLVAGIY